MSDDSAEFTLRLIDQITGPASQMGKALGRVRNALQSVQGATGGDLSKTMGAAFGPKTASNALRGFEQVGKAAQASQNATWKQVKRGWGEIGKAAMASERARLKAVGAAAKAQAKIERGRTRQAFSGFAEIAKAAKSAEAKRFKLDQKNKSSTADFVKGALIAGAIEKGIGLMRDLSETVVRAAGEYVVFGQNARFAFDALAKHGALPEKLFEHARALAVRFGLDVQDTTHAYQQFLKLQFAPKAADELVRMGGDLRALGSSAEDVKGIFLALGQIKSKGKFQAEEGLQLAERGISGELINEELAKALGKKSTAEVQALQQKGKITANVALAAIKEAIKRKLGEKNLGDAGAKFADSTIDGITGRFKALGQDTIVKLVDRMTNPLTKLASKGLGRFEDFVESPKGAATIDTMATALGRAADFGANLAGAFGSGFGDTFNALSEGARPFIKLLAGGDGKTAVSMLGLVAKHLGQFAALALGVAAGVGVVVTGVAMLSHTLGEVALGLAEGLIAPLGKMAGDVVLWWDNLKAIWDAQGLSLTEKALGIGKMVVKGFVGGIESLLALPGDVVFGMARGTVDAFKSALGIHSPSTEARDIADNFGGTYTTKLGDHVSDAKTAGAALGYASYAGLSTTSSNAMVGPIASSFAVQPGFSSDAIGGRGLVSFSPSINVEVTGTSDPEEAGRIAAREVRRELEAFWRQLEMEE